MKSSVLIILATLLATAILAPSVIALTSVDEKAITIDFNEEETKETTEKDFLFSLNSNVISWQQKEKTAISDFYLDSNSATSIAIFLPPPRPVQYLS